MKTNFSMLFYVKKQKNYTSGLAPIYLRITVDGKRSEITTNWECIPEKWNSKSGRLIGTKEEIKSFNAFLDNFQSKVYEAHRYLSENEKPITPETLKDQFLGKIEKARMLIEIFKDHNLKVGNLIGNEFAPATLKRYETSLRHTQAFLKYQYGVSDINIRTIDNAFVSDYDFYLRSIRKCANNSTLKYIRNFGKIVRICLSNGWIVANPFTNYKGKIKTIDRVYLSAEELQMMADKQFDIERLGLVRDVFLFCCFTGLAYVDIKKLKTSQIKKGLDGEQWIFIRDLATVLIRGKGNKLRRCPLWQQTANELSTLASDRNPSDHVFINRRHQPLTRFGIHAMVNRYVRQIVKNLPSIEKKRVSPHTIRHTTATHLLRAGVDINTIRAWLGHVSINTTNIYAEVDLEMKAKALACCEIAVDNKSTHWRNNKDLMSFLESI